MPRPSATAAMEPMPATEIRISDAHPGSLRDVYLDRLQRLARLRCQHEQELNARGIRLLDRAIFAVYYDCRRADIEREARKILRQSQFDIDAPDDAA